MNATSQSAAKMMIAMLPLCGSMLGSCGKVFL
jgi:hypothetical protein